ncbi:MAG TPA: hypothetical protein VKQ29_15130 [Aliidongia sp.]|nr:hypothetical protein [Aliidongia sp.]
MEQNFLDILVVIFPLYRRALDIKVRKKILMPPSSRAPARQARLYLFGFDKLRLSGAM